MTGNPMDVGSKSNELVEQIRKRKGLKAGIPPLENFIDKL
jgi:elongation factor 2